MSSGANGSTYQPGDWVSFTSEQRLVGRVVDDTPVDGYLIETPDGQRIHTLASDISGLSQDIVAAVAGLSAYSFAMRLRWCASGAHVHARLFVGRPKQSLAMAGRLVFRREEWESFVTTARLLGVITPRIEIEFVEEALTVDN